MNEQTLITDLRLGAELTRKNGYVYGLLVLANNQTPGCIVGVINYIVTGDAMDWNSGDNPRWNAMVKAVCDHLNIDPKDACYLAEWNNSLKIKKVLLTQESRTEMVAQAFEGAAEVLLMTSSTA